MQALTPIEWKRLPPAEKARLRALKHERRRLAKQSGQPGQPNQLIQPNQPTGPESSPFVSARQINEPIDLSFIGGGGPCFILLSGPSARDLDLGQLALRGIYTIATNNAGTIWRPNAWTCVDPVSKFHNSIWLDPGVLKICPSTMTRRHIRRKLPDGSFSKIDAIGGGWMTPADCPATIGYIRRPTFRPESYLSESFINWGVSKKFERQEKKAGRERPRILNVMLAVLKIAYSMGFRHVFLLGCDFHMDAEHPYSFAQGKHNGGATSNNNAYRLLQGMFMELLPVFAGAGFHVYNCNPQSGLTSFPNVDYDDAIKSATEHIPQDPLDARDWYQK